ncbi:hypothetical protein IWQ62_003920 [Dispira parvispora]|uniref:Uncharacterized protein n=1 Tax=Dispira parvispora TaxID=1520584 RepID=A0A9W8E5W1_9FUNG|nr:hypothetical protein IWQ62_003920 [Dispira parvispora]
MHRFTVASFLVVSMSALSGVFGNPGDSLNTDMTSPKIYRRETKELKLKLLHSVFYEKMVKPNFAYLECSVSGFKKLYDPGSKTDFANNTRNAQGVYFEDKQQWYRRSTQEEASYDADGCYKPVDGPQTAIGAKLEPFTSIVTKSFKLRTKLFIKELKGIKVDNNVEHNGCVKVVEIFTDDSDLSMYISTAERKDKYFKGLDKVSVIEDELCEIQQYKLE